MTHKTDDELIWCTFIQKVKPLKPDNKYENFKKKTFLKRQFNLLESTYKNKTPNLEFSVIPSEIEPQLHSLSRKNRRAFLIDATLDLHGLNQQQAFEKTVLFVEYQFKKRNKNLLIITGKGHEGQGVLKNALPQWLFSNLLNDKVVAFSHASQEHGGHGAFYVKLRRPMS